MAFFAPDHAEYEVERGFYLDYGSDVPGPVFTTSTELAAYLRPARSTSTGLRRFAAESFDVADGRATARFVDELVEGASPRGGR